MTVNNPFLHFSMMLNRIITLIHFAAQFERLLAVLTILLNVLLTAQPSQAWCYSVTSLDFFLFSSSVLIGIAFGLDLIQSEIKVNMGILC